MVYEVLNDISRKREKKQIILILHINFLYSFFTVTCLNPVNSGSKGGMLSSNTSDSVAPPEKTTYLARGIYRGVLIIGGFS